MSKQEDQASRFPLDTTKEIRTTKQERTNAKRKFTRKAIGFHDMIENDCPFIAIKDKFEDIKDAYRQVEKCNDLVNSF